MILGEMIQTFSTVTTLEEFAQRFMAEMSALGFDRLALGFLPRRLELAPAMPRNLSSYPLEWLQRYEAQGYLYQDAAVRRPLQNPQEWFFWHQRQGLNAMENRILDEAADFGLKNGLCFATATSASLGMLGLGWHGHHEDMENYLACHRSRVWMLANVAQITALHRFGGEMLRAYQDLLDPRQKQLLGWLADGLNPEAIADRLNLSQRSIQHLQAQLCQRLRVQTPTEALVVANELGLLP